MIYYYKNFIFFNVLFLAMTKNCTKTLKKLTSLYKENLKINVLNSLHKENSFLCLFLSVFV